jgi:hypothetical protein
MMQYQIIYADPPWRQSRGGAKSVRPLSSGIELPYPVLSLEEIRQHLFNAVLETTPDSIMFLWTIDKFLFEAEKNSNRVGVQTTR